ncbi:winged helix-turn-helix transcriptional regulator [Catellatospora bangladeshensis]|uniref:Transcriptional regulator n=1 Tax=Catellatospora bangladeshensis TaxID=310355 RepID=A0A8J3NKA5_9ACTN|nr:helix-turn-helix domain-containing protein [Catellatospora bangladeshensis]GIF84220.1 transcriptional regulator [Catellatospora bangladeshensis]
MTTAQHSPGLHLDHPSDAACRSFQPVLELLGRRWVGMVLLAGQRGARRFGQYRAFVHGISDRVLTQRLRELEQVGLLERQVIPSTPVQILYAPTARGTELIDAMQPLFEWTARNPGALDKLP